MKIINNGRTKAGIFCALLLCASITHARIGETLSQCIERYGEYTESAGSDPIFEKNGFLVRVCFYQGKADQLVFMKMGKTGRTIAISDDEKLVFLNANGSAWRKTGRFVWKSGDGLVSAAQIDLSFSIFSSDKIARNAESEKCKVARKIERKWTSKSGHSIIAELSYHDATNIYLNVEGKNQSVPKSLISSNDLAFLKSVPIKRTAEKRSTNIDQEQDIYFPTQQQLEIIEKLRKKVWGLHEELIEVKDDSGDMTPQKIAIVLRFIDVMDSYYLHLHRANPIVFPDIGDYGTKEITGVFAQLRKRESYLKDYNIDVDPKYGFHSRHYEMARICLIFKYTNCYSEEIKNGQTPTKFGEKTGY